MISLGLFGTSRTLGAINVVYFAEFIVKKQCHSDFLFLQLKS